MNPRSVLLAIAAATALPAGVMAADAEFVAPSAPDRTPVERETIPVREGPGFIGIFTQIFRSPRPLQMINPLAPSYYGSGEQNVVDGEDSSVKGANSPLLAFFGIEW